MINDYNFFIKEKSYNDIIKFLVNKKPEQGGIIGCSVDGIISDFYYDRNPKRTTISSYVPNVNNLNNVINIEWSQKGISFVGFIHSHINCNELSYEDITYAREILSRLPNCSYIIMGIVVLDNLYMLKDVLWYQIMENNCFKLKVLKI